MSGLIDSSTFVAGLEADGWKTRPIGPNRDGTMASRGRRRVHVYGCGLITLHVANEAGATVVQRAWWDPVDAWLAVAS